MREWMILQVKEVTIYSLVDVVDVFTELDRFEVIFSAKTLGQ